MNRVTLLLSRVGVVLLGATALFACASEANKSDMLKGESEQMEIFAEGVPGGIQSSVSHLSAEVKAINYETREVTLQDKEGNQKTLTVGPEAVNFNQVKKGDQIDITVAQELVIYLKEEGAASQNEMAVMAARAPEGNKPTAILADMVEITAVVTAVDIENHSATLKFPDGSSNVVKVRKDVALDPSQVGREVVFRSSAGMVLTVEKPQTHSH